MPDVVGEGLLLLLGLALRLQRLEVSTRWSDQGLVLLDLVAVAP